MKQEDRIYIAGHRGMVGGAIKRILEKNGFHNLVCRSHTELDLINQSAVAEFFKNERPDYVFLAAAKVGGIHANDTYSSDFLYENLMIQNNVIHNAYVQGVKKLCFLGSSCIYPKMAPQPIKEEYLLSGLLESTNEAYAVAKIAGIKLCEMYRKQYGCDFISVMPCNLYGIGDSYHPQNSHVFPAFIRKIHLAKALQDTNREELVRIYRREREVKNAELVSDTELTLWLEESGIFAEPDSPPRLTLWGSGMPKREFMFADDLADACLFLMQNYSNPQIINVGAGIDQSLKELAELISALIGYKGEISWDGVHPDGTPCKLMDVSRIAALGWAPKTCLADGILAAHRNFIE